MADPFTIVAAVAAVASGVTAYAAGKYQQQIGKANAAIGRKNARRARDRAALEAQDLDRETAGLLGQQEAIQAASGLDLMGTSQIRTRRTARELGRRDVLNRIQEGELEAYNFETDAMNARAQGELANIRGTGSLITSFFKAGGKFGREGESAPFNPSFGPRLIY